MADRDTAGRSEDTTALRTASSELHARETEDDLTANTPGGPDEPTGATDTGSPQADPAAGAPPQDDDHPADAPPPTRSTADDADRMRTAERGREADAAGRSETSLPRPRETPAPAETPGSEASVPTETPPP
jgi:hypothetical protein